MPQPDHPAATTPPSPLVRYGLAAAYLAMAMALAACGVRLWHITCEGFGCTGVGIAWLAWSVVGAAVFGLGWFSHGKQSGQLRKLVFAALLLQACIGLVLVGYWIRTAA